MVEEVVARMGWGEHGGGEVNSEPYRRCPAAQTPHAQSQRATARLIRHARRRRRRRRRRPRPLPRPHRSCRRLRPRARRSCPPRPQAYARAATPRSQRPPQRSVRARPRRAPPPRAAARAARASRAWGGAARSCAGGRTRRRRTRPGWRGPARGGAPARRSSRRAPAGRKSPGPTSTPRPPRPRPRCAAAHTPPPLARCLAVSAPRGDGTRGSEPERHAPRMRCPATIYGGTKREGPGRSGGAWGACGAPGWAWARPECAGRPARAGTGR